MSPLEKNALLAVRFLSLVFVAFGLWSIITAFAQSWDQLDYIYLNVFLIGQVTPGITATIFGGIVLLASRPVARLLTRGL